MSVDAFELMIRGTGKLIVTLSHASTTLDKSFTLSKWPNTCLEVLISVDTGLLALEAQKIARIFGGLEYQRSLGQQDIWRLPCNTTRDITHLTGDEEGPAVNILTVVRELL